MIEVSLAGPLTCEPWTPPGAELVNLRGATLLPGFVDPGLRAAFFEERPRRQRCRTAG